MDVTQYSYFTSIKYREYFKEINTNISLLIDFFYHGEISNILIDTYNREIERYGENTIEEAEILFCINSEFYFTMPTLR